MDSVASGNASVHILEDSFLDELHIGSSEWWLKHGAPLILLAFGIFIGLLVNTLLLWVICKSHKLQTTQDILIANNCVILLVQSLIIIPWMVSFRVTRIWYFSPSWCLFSLFAEEVMSGVFCMNLLGLALNHARIAFWVGCKQREVIKILLVIFPWVVGLFTAPRWFLDRQINIGENQCEMHIIADDFYHWCMFVALRNYFVPIALTFVVLALVSVWEWYENRTSQKKFGDLIIQSLTEMTPCIDAAAPCANPEQAVAPRERSDSTVPVVNLSRSKSSTSTTSLTIVHRASAPNEHLPLYTRSVSAPRPSLVDFLSEGKQPLSTVIGMLLVAVVFPGPYYAINALEGYVLNEDFTYKISHWESVLELSVWLLDSVVFMVPVVIVLCSRRYRRALSRQFAIRSSSIQQGN